MSQQRKLNKYNSNQQLILDLEKKYYLQLKKIFTSFSFLHDLKEIETNIQENYQKLDGFWQIKNKIKVPLERLIRFHIYNNISPLGVFYSPLSSDLALYTKDALINIDAKTTDLHGNRGDDSTIVVERNQISFRNKKMSVTPPFAGINYLPNLPSIDTYKNVPVLTYILRVTYTDNTKSFHLNHITFDCIPNGELSELFENDIIENFKTYHYLTKTQAEKFGRKELLPKKSIKSNWLELSVGGGHYFFDNETKNPYHPEQSVIWGFVDNVYKINIGGHSARISPNSINKRYDSCNREWFAHQRWNI